MMENRTVWQLLEARAQGCADDVALISGGGRAYTYGELWRQVERTAGALAGRGICRNDRVAIVLPDGPEMVVTFLATVAVAASAPLNPAYSLDDFLFYLGDLRARVLITAEGTAPLAQQAAAKLGIPVLLVREASRGESLLPAPDACASAGAGEEKVGEWAQSQDVALVLHTSGTTAKPKQVPLLHQNLAYSARNIAQSLGLGAGDRCLNVMPLFHVHGLIGAVLSSLVSGGSVVCTGGFSAGKCFEWMQRHSPTWFTAVPTMHQALLAELGRGGVLPARGQLRFVRSCSSALAPKLMGELEQAWGVPVIEAYGMTEASHQMASNPLPPAVRKAGSVGVATGTEVAVMDAGGELLPADTVGEVVVRGENVTRGYEGNDEANVKSFTNGWFRTGDQGRLDSAGYLFLTGRLKEIIIRGGEKIAPREIDEVLLEHPAVAQAVGFGCPHVTLGEDVVAAVVLRAGAAATGEELREFAVGRLAAFKVPSRVVIVEKIPKGPTGKMQRANLAQQLADKLRSAYLAPRDELEAFLADIWSEILDVPQVGVWDNFFALGGDSLQSTAAVLRVNELFEIECPMSVVFLHPILDRLAEQVRQRVRPERLACLGQALRENLAGERGSGLRAVRLKLREEARAQRRIVARDWSAGAGAGAGWAPLSFAQERMWFLAQFEPEAPTYNNSRLCLKMKGSLDAGILEKALNQILERHTVLRSCFPLMDGEPTQVVCNWEHRRLARHDFSKLAHDEREKQCAELARAVVLEPYNLVSGPLVRMALARLAPEEHLLVVGFHHVVFDVWSRRIFQAEMRELYTSLLRGRAPALVRLPIQYRDFAVWQREQSRSMQEADLVYWRGTLAGELPVLNLPTRGPRPEVLRYRGGRCERVLRGDWVAKLEGAARAQNATLYMLLLAAYAALLYRYTGEEDCIVGCPVAGRLQEDIEPLIGCFLNTLPIRLRIVPGQSFGDLLRNTREAVLGAFDHQGLPFERLVEAINPPRVLNRTPIVQTILNLRNVSPAALHWDDVEVNAWDFDDGLAQFDLALELDELPDGLRLLVRYDRDLFEAGAMERLADHYLALLDSLAKAPEGAVDRAMMLQQAERQQLLVEWNQTARDYPQDCCIHDLFGAQAAKTPGAVAVVWNEQELTYGELDARANQLACYLKELGVGPEVRVGVYLERSSEMIVGLLGILKAGGAYVPLDPAYPAERVALILEDAEIGLVLTQESLVSRLPSRTVRMVFLSSVPRQKAEGAPCSMARSSNLAYLIYTSGSTGRPKGVAIEHGSAVSFLHWARTVFTDEEFAGVLFGTSLNFDLSVFELFATLSWGGTVILVQNVLELPQGARRYPVRLINTVPSAMAELLRARGLPPSVLTVNLAGEPLKQALVKELYRAGVKRVYDLYGPTETTTYSTWTLREVDGPETIGRPLANTRVYVLDEARQLVPVGVKGELYIGGSGLARGYWQREELTAERFVQDPYSAEPEARMYRTGDQCRWRPDGMIEYLGRLDQQVKIRGFRIELGEVEACLRQCRGVGECVAAAREDAERGKQLVAYVVPSSQQALDVTELRSALQQKLPEYMIPAVIMVLDSLPVMPNGKVDRKALPEPRRTEAPSAEPVAPRDDLERVLAGIWAELLEVEQVGIRDNFFELGGHSLLAVELALRVEQALGWHMPIAALFQTPTVESLGQAIRQGKERPFSLVPIQARGTRAPFYFIHGMDGNVYAFLGLARVLGEDQPVYGLQALSDANGDYLHGGVEEMAAQYVKEIRAFQPQGPYYLGGYSIGGWLAYEVAQQLHRQRGEVRMLALLDTRLKGPLPWSFHLWMHLPYWRKRFVDHCRLIYSVPAGERAAYLSGKVKSVKRILGNDRAKSAAATRMAPTALRPADHSAGIEFLRAAVNAYKVRPYAGSAHFFASQDAYIAPVLKSWRRLVRGGISVHGVSGDHFAMLDPEHVQQFAQVFGPLLRQVQDR